MERETSIYKPPIPITSQICLSLPSQALYLLTTQLIEFLASVKNPWV